MTTPKTCENCKYSVANTRRDGLTWCDFWHFNFSRFDTCSLYEENNPDKQITFDEILGGAQ